jgi:erythromycin esterase
MKTRLPQLVLLCVIAQASHATSQSPQRALSAEDSAAVAWIRTNAVPVQTLNAGSAFTDFAPLKAILQDTRIVGLGESSHGTSEFQRAKHRLFEFLVKEMGYTVFTLEAAYSDAQPMNDYVLHGKGNRADVLSKLGYVAWDTEEFAAMVDWMRAYNRSVPEARKIRFFGVDLYRNSVGRSKVLAAVRRVLPTAVTTTDSLFRALAEQERRWPAWDTTVIAGARPALNALANELEFRRHAAPGRLSQAEWDDVLKLLDVMRRAAMLQDRDRHIAENLLYLVEHEPPGTKFVFWAHNGHVRAYSGAAGYSLRQRYGDAYYALGLFFNQGAYLSRSFSPTNDFKITNKPAAAAGSLEWFLARAELPLFFLNLRAASRTPAIDAWLRTSRDA